MSESWSEYEPLATQRLWSLTDDVFVEKRDTPDSFVVLSRWGELEVKDAGAVAAEFLRRMGFGPVSPQNVLPDGVGAETARRDRSGLGRLLDQLGGVLVHSLGHPNGRGPLLSVLPMVAEPSFRPHRIPADRAVRLSRFSAMRAVDGVMLLEAPTAAFQVLLHLPAAPAVAAALSRPATVGQLASTSGTAVEVVDDLVAFLVAAGVVLLADAAGRFAEDGDPTAAGWTHHELLFHQRSRHRALTSPSEQLLDTAAIAPSPVTRVGYPGAVVVLPRVDLVEVAERDPALTVALEREHACPHPAGGELDLHRVGELLFRAARVRGVGPAHVPMRGGISYEASQRPYFNIACLYELEVYLTVGRCTGLAPGIYHYDPLAHALVLVTDDEARSSEMLDRAKVGAGASRAPAGALAVAARMPRTTWLLAGTSYAFALVHAGALLQTVYLVGHAVGIACHPVVADGNRTADAVLGLPWPDEVELVECVLEPEH